MELESFNSSHDSTDKTKSIEDQAEKDEKVTRLRWFYLGSFLFMSMANSFQFPEYMATSKTISNFYGITEQKLVWTSLIYMVFYLIFIMPVLYISDKWGLRMTVLTGAFVTTLGTSLKVFSAFKDGFFFIICAQCFLGISQIILTNVPKKVANKWFKESEIRTVNFFCNFWTQFATGLGFFLFPIIINLDKNKDGSSMDLFHCTLLALVIFDVFLLVFFFRYKLLRSDTTTYGSGTKVTPYIFMKSAQYLSLNSGFMFNCIAHAIATGPRTVTMLFLSQLLRGYTEHAEDHSGRIVVIFILIGSLGTYLNGKILTNTNLYKESIFFSYFLSTAAFTAVMLSLWYQKIVLIYFSIITYGSLGIIYSTAAQEMTLELTFPMHETITVTIFTFVNHLFTIMTGWFVGEELESIGTMWILAIMLILMISGTILTFFVPNEKRRQLAMTERDTLRYFSMPQLVLI